MTSVQHMTIMCHALCSNKDTMKNNGHVADSRWMSSGSIIKRTIGWNESGRKKVRLLRHWKKRKKRMVPTLIFNSCQAGRPLLRCLQLVTSLPCQGVIWVYCHVRLPVYNYSNNKMLKKIKIQNKYVPFLLLKILEFF